MSRVFASFGTSLRLLQNAAQHQATVAGQLILHLLDDCKDYMQMQSVMTCWACWGVRLGLGDCHVQ
jgi:hypothetical protein